MRLDVTGDTLALHLSRKDEALALKRSFELPLSHVVGVRVEPRKAMEAERGIRAPGTGFPGKVALGTWRGKGGKQFWYVHSGDRVLVLDLADEDYARLVLEVADPDAWASQIREAVHA
jgi:hypothetical protein